MGLDKVVFEICPREHDWRKYKILTNDESNSMMEQWKHLHKDDEIVRLVKKPEKNDKDIEKWSHRKFMGHVNAASKHIGLQYSEITAENTETKIGYTLYNTWRRQTANPHSHIRFHLLT